MTIEILVNFSDNDYIITQINGTLSEAKEYYVGNQFMSDNEQARTGINMWIYEEWKCDVLQSCLENSNTALNFDDENELFTFKTPQNDLVTVTYEQVKHSMTAVQGWTFGDYYSTGWNMPTYETKEEAIQATKDYFKTSDGRFVEVGWLVNVNNQINVVKCEKLDF